MSNEAARVPVQVLMWLPCYQHPQGKPLNYDLPIRSFIFETWKGVSGDQKLENQWNVYL